jgi:hypothetical protein
VNRVHHPFYKDWPPSDPSKSLTPETLYHWHKMFWVHDAKWCIHILGGAGIDLSSRFFTRARTPAFDMVTKFRSAVISLEEKNVSSLTSALPFVRSAPTCFTSVMLNDDDSLSRILSTPHQKDALHTPSLQPPGSCQAFKPLLQCLEVNGGGPTTLSSQVPSNVAFTLAPSVQNYRTWRNGFTPDQRSHLKTMTIL